MENDDGVVGVDLWKKPAEKGLVGYGEDGYVGREEDLDEEKGYEDEELGEKDCESEVSCVRKREKQRAIRWYLCFLRWRPAAVSLRRSSKMLRSLNAACSGGRGGIPGHRPQTT